MGNFSNKKNVLQLVALMINHGVKKVVLCPGSRDIPIVQTILSSNKFEVYSITDERSAGFFAIGLAQENLNREPVAIVVTSGSALLNLHPAVSEAFYQQIPLLVISADRPKAWIGQMDGQTLPQEDVFKTLVKKSVSLVEVQSDEDEWYCNRLINEALLALNHNGLGPVQINVPISDPFFSFEVDALPQVRTIKRYDYTNFRELELPQYLYDDQDKYEIDLATEQQKFLQSIKSDYTLCSSEDWAQSLAAYLKQAKSIMLVVGQSVSGLGVGKDSKLWQDLSEHMIVMAETIANVEYDSNICTQVDLMISQLSQAAPLVVTDNQSSPCSQSYKRALRAPDLVITVGGHIISKSLRKFLRAHHPRNHLHVSPSGEVVDLFQCVNGIIQLDEQFFIRILHRAVTILKEQYSVDLDKLIKDTHASTYTRYTSTSMPNLEMLCSMVDNAKVLPEDYANARYIYAYLAKIILSKVSTPKFEFSHMMAVEQLLNKIPDNCALHLANSSSVRYGQMYGNKMFKDRNVTVLANRGVNGIEGSLSAAMGYAAASKDLNIVVIGDLSFFYDMNALWNNYVSNNVRILLLNNGGGEIFHALPGLSLDSKGKHYVTAQHNTSAQDWATSRGFKYCKVVNENELDNALDLLVAPLEQCDSPVLVEFCTKATTDALCMKKGMSDSRTKAYASLVE